MGILGVLVLTSIVAWLSTWLLRKYIRIQKLLNKIQGPTALPVIGNLHQFRLNPDEFFEQAQGIAYMFREQPGIRMVRVWLGPLPFVVVYGAEECEAILSSNQMLTKMIQYQFLAPWIGEGLLISKPEKWRPRRKLLTPTFHYDILKDFVPIYNRHARTLCSKFERLTKEYTDIFHTISLCTLDIICEAALGVVLDAQGQEHTEYLDAVFRIKKIIHHRMVRPYLYADLIFRWFGEGNEQERCVKALHDFTGKAILARKQAIDEAGGIQQFYQKKAEEDGRSVRRALLDLMLEMHGQGDLDLEGIQEEVDTFTFEGHDTTSAALNWFLHLLGVNPQIQARLQREIDDVLGPEREVTYDDLANLKYVDACLKETLRLYPSVPLIARMVTEDTKIKEFTIPAGTGVAIAASMVHRDTAYWKNPEVFDPERFVNNDYLKHPYCYIPFSAGARNCIGQRFATMEEKCLIANIFRRFHVYSRLRTDQMRVAAELIIRPMYGNWIRMERRNFGEYRAS